MNNIKISRVDAENAKQVKATEQSGAALLLKVLLYALCGFLFSRSILLSTISPLGCAFAGACPKKGLFLYFGAMILGTITGSADNKLRYLAAIAVIIGVRWALNAFGKISSNHLFNCTLVFIATLGSGLMLSWSQLGGRTLGTIETISEALLSAGICYIFRRSVAFIDSLSKHDSAMPNIAEGAYLTVSLCLLLSCANSVTYLGISPFMSLMMTAVLVCAYRFKMQGGAIAAIAASVSICLSNPELIAIGFGFAVAGFVAGIMSGGGKIACVAGFAMSLFIYYFLCQSQLQGFMQLDGMSLLSEGAIAIVIFLVLPESLLMRLDKLFLHDSALSTTSKSTSTALNLLSQASVLNDTASMINSTAQVSYRTDSHNIMQMVGRRICAECSLFRECCDKNSRLIDTLYRNESEKAPAQIIDMCMKPEEMKATVSQILEQRKYRDELDKRAKGMRQILSSSLLASGELLHHAAFDAITDKRIDRTLSLKLHKTLIKNGIKPLKTTVEKLSRRIKITVELDNSCRIETERLRRIMKEATERNIQAVRISSVSDYCDSVGIYSHTHGQTSKNRNSSEHEQIRIAVAYENFNYNIKTAISQKSRNNARVCGDVCSSFERGSQFIMSLCDGMGAGGHAAMTGMLVSEMLNRTLSSGIEYKTALDIIGTAIAVKSGEENLCTVDIAGIDMNTAQLNIIKAGGAPTFIKTQNGIKCLGKTGLPIGILKEAALEAESFSLSRGDIILMVSDGVLGVANDWIEEELNRFDDGDIQTLADEILERAAMERNGCQEDDMSVFIGLVA